MIRRALTALMCLAALSGCAESGDAPSSAPTLSGGPPIVIAHRGASGLLPEHTIEAYTLAVQQGADFIEPDLVMTRDGVLIARHDRHLSTSTNVADLPEFADRRRTQEVYAVSRTDWWAEDFTLAEIKTLRARQPYTGRSTDYDDQFEVPTFQEVVDLAIASGVGLYPETKSPSHHAAIGLDMKAPLLDTMEGLMVPVYIQSFEAQILRELDEMTQFPLVQLYSGDRDAIAAGFEPPLEEIGAYADGVGPGKHLLWAAPGMPSDFVAQAHGYGLVVHPWTVRDDHVGEGFETVEDELAALYAQGVDGVFTDFPETALNVRKAD